MSAPRWLTTTCMRGCESHPALECESAPGRQLIHAERSSNGSGQVGWASEVG